MLNRIELKPTSIEREIFPKMAEDGQLYAMDLKGHWMDVGQPPDYLTGMGMHLKYLASKNDKNLAKGEHVHGPVFIDPSAKIGQGCCFGPNVVIGANVVIGDGVRLINTAVFKGAVIRNHSWLNRTIVGWECIIGSWVRMENDTVLGEDVTVADEVYINGAKVLPHKSLTDSIAEPTVIL
jgi:mannose-1-phosphate guanylyltransferase